MTDKPDYEFLQKIAQVLDLAVDSPCTKERLLCEIKRLKQEQDIAKKIVEDLAAEEILTNYGNCVHCGAFRGASHRQEHAASCLYRRGVEYVIDGIGAKGIGFKRMRGFVEVKNEGVRNAGGR